MDSRSLNHHPQGSGLWALIFQSPLGILAYPNGVALGPTGTLRHSVAQLIPSRTLGQCPGHLQQLPDALFFGEDAEPSLPIDKCVSLLEGRTEVRAVQEWSIVFLSCQPIWDRGFHTSDCFQLRAKAVHNNPLNGLSARIKGGQLLKLNRNLFASKENITSTSSVSC